ncbi:MULTISPECIES: ABC transporter ATP-binding protein [Enterococcus]|uniref:ATP-binding cassette domain-containing protein n=1 Tax=Enterococcus alishanensis TaxID=1303817 RepID=A0ABS6TBU8_9ENTE|nr:ATP-binding cassette domain-containing protein [Enterococcus alishanensis]MBV7390383.1 ATP-binding cassette domain-containing protein [Enterococcus alishanensis]
MTLLKVENISYRLSNDKIILSDINLNVDTQDFITITGPSGGGKSTLLKIIASLVTPTVGKIYLEEQLQTDYLYTDYRKEVSYCFQQPTLFGETVGDNLRFPFEVRNLPFNQKAAVEKLKAVALPASYLDKKITELSGGEKQRVALIRNILFSPKLLLLDEVTTGLDEDSKKIVHQLIDQLQQTGVTIIQVTHDETEIYQAKKVLWIKGGKLAYEPSRG